jgi:hypothetical protein
MIFTDKEWKDIEQICKDRTQHYDRFFIPKSSGGKREILAPSIQLKGLQKKLLNEFIYAHYIPSVYATGFIVDRSIVHNAMAHVGSKVLVNVDLKDFFPTVTGEMLVFDVFFKKLKRLSEIDKQEKVAKKKKEDKRTIRSEEFALTKTEEKQLLKEAKLLTSLVTYPYKRRTKVIDALPQGAPTSPALSNIICFEMDNVLAGVAYRNQAVYTRYADDITFSSSSNTKINRLIPVIKEVVKKYGFRANEKKIRVNRRSGRMSVTGLVVNDKVSYGRGRLRILRAMLHNAKMEIKDGNIPAFNEMHFRGLAAYINSFDTQKAKKMNKEIDEIIEGIRKLKKESKCKKTSSQSCQAQQ